MSFISSWSSELIHSVMLPDAELTENRKKKKSKAAKPKKTHYWSNYATTG